MITLSALAEESVTWETVEAQDQPFSGSMTKLALPVRRPEIYIHTVDISIPAIHDRQVHLHKKYSSQ